MAVQAVPDLKLIPIARQTLDAVHFPRWYWWIFASIRAAAGALRNGDREGTGRQPVIAGSVSAAESASRSR